MDGWETDSSQGVAAGASGTHCPLSPGGNVAYQLSGIRSEFVVASQGFRVFLSMYVSSLSLWG